MDFRSQFQVILPSPEHYKSVQVNKSLSLYSLSNSVTSITYWVHFYNLSRNGQVHITSGLDRLNGSIRLSATKYTIIDKTLTTTIRGRDILTAQRHSLTHSLTHPASNTAPTEGNSTNTISPNASQAWSEIPTTPTSPTIYKHTSHTTYYSQYYAVPCYVMQCNIHKVKGFINTECVSECVSEWGSECAPYLDVLVALGVSGGKQSQLRLSHHSTLHHRDGSLQRSGKYIHHLEEWWVEEWE